MIARFGLSEASAYVVRNRLKGPYADGSGAPFLAVISADNVRYEHMLVNSLGPVEMWAFSTTPVDVALRKRLYARVGPGEARRRLAACSRLARRSERSSGARMSGSSEGSWRSRPRSA